MKYKHLTIEEREKIQINVTQINPKIVGNWQEVAN